MVYLERLRTRHPQTFCATNPNDMYLASLMLATKFMNDCGLDEFIWNDEWAATAHYSMQRINQLELRMLDDLVSGFFSAWCSWFRSGTVRKTYKVCMSPISPQKEHLSCSEGL